MNETTKFTEDVVIAQFRFSLIAPVIQGLYPDASATAYFKRITEKPIQLPNGCVPINTVIKLSKNGLPFIGMGAWKPVHEALRQRITVHYNYEGLSDEEVLAYIHHKIEKAGGSKTIIDVSGFRLFMGYHKETLA